MVVQIFKRSEVVLALENGTGGQRFQALLAGTSQALHDKPLLERADWVVAPTLGAIIPNWILALPRRPVLSFRDWAAKGGPSASDILTEVLSEVGLAPAEVIWFEHGPATAGTVVGCGLDHAHLHVLLRPTFDFGTFADCARAASNLEWRETAASNCLTSLMGTSSYLVAGSGNRAIYSRGVEAAGSQFFRRVVAKLVGAGDRWNYRQFAQPENIAATIENFNRFREAARVER
jgi:hypothetical protein